MTDEIYSHVIEGKLIKNVSQLNQALKRYEGKEIIITIENVSRKRSSQQNRYIHRLFTIFTNALNELGNEFTMSDIKGICAMKFLLIEEIDYSTGEIMQRLRGTSELSTTELNEFFEKIIAWAADMFGIILPYPNENEINT